MDNNGQMTNRSHTTQLNSTDLTKWRQIGYNWQKNWQKNPKKKRIKSETRLESRTETQLTGDVVDSNDDGNKVETQ